MSAVGIGLFELLILLLGNGSFIAGGLLGMPPGDRDARMQQAARADSLFYIEWAGRATGNAAVTGFAADPEVREFMASAVRAVRTVIDHEMRRMGPHERKLVRVVPPMVARLSGQPGCAYVSFDSAAVTPQFPPGPGLLRGVRAAVVVNGGEATGDIAKDLTAMLSAVPARIRAEEFDHLDLPIPLPIPLTLHQHESYFILGFGEGVVDDVVAGLEERRPGLVRNERFAIAAGHVEYDQTALLTWCDVHGLVDVATGQLGPQGTLITDALQRTGLDKLEYIVSATGVVDGAMRQRTFVRTGGSTDGLLSLFGGRSITSADFAAVPADADLVAAVSVNASGVLDSIRDIVVSFDQRSADRLEAMILQAEDAVGVSLEEDLFKAFGQTIVISNSPGEGGWFATSPVASIAITDAQAAYRVVSQVARELNAFLPGVREAGGRLRGVGLSQQKFLDRTVYYVNTVGDDVPVAPAFCMTPSHLLIALHPQAIKSRLRFLEDDDRQAWTMNPATPDGTELLFYSWFDTRKLARQAYGFVPWAAQLGFSQVQSRGVEMDVFSVPSGRAVLPHIRESWSRGVRTDEGLLYETQNGLPIPAIGAAAANFPDWWLTGVTNSRIMRPVLRAREATEAAAPEDTGAEFIKLP